MRVPIQLGLRLAAGTGGQRGRSLLTVAASGLGVAVLLLVWGFAHSQVGTTSAFSYNPLIATALMAGTVGMVALPVLVSVATIARLSARLRDRRLANLRLLGLSAGQTRVVAATEVGVACLLGVTLGVVSFLALLPFLAGLGVAGRSLTIGSLIPPLFAWVSVLVAVPAVAVLTAAIPQRLASAQALSQTRSAGAGSLRLIRLIPLSVGFLLCWGTRNELFDRRQTLPPAEVAAILVGIALLAIGMLLVIPVFVQLVATLVLRLGRGPLPTLVGRRLQTQPAGATRVIAALMLGLFIVVGARGVLTAFLSTPQYVHAADFVERAQTAEVLAAPGEAASTTRTLHSVEGVRRVASFALLHGQSVRSDPSHESGVPVLVASCAQLSGGDEPITGCSDDVPSVVNAPGFSESETLAVRISRGFSPRGSQVPVPLARAVTLDAGEFERVVGAMTDQPVIVLPPSWPGVTELLPRTDTLVVAHAGPGHFLYDRIEAAGLPLNSMVDLENYDFVQGMLTLIRTLATVIISIGLLTFTIASIDRALSRRRELTALRLLGTPGRMLRSAQWWEAALPTVFGSLLAIAAGDYAGATYLQLGDDQVMPLTTLLTLGLIATLTSIVLAWITTLGTTARLDPEHIRAE